MADNKKIAEDVLNAVGGKENVNSVTHCMTRLRFILKDEGKAPVDAINKVNGVINTVRAGGQTQVIIGTHVDKVYDELCALGGFEKLAAVDENLDADAPKEKLTVKGVINNLMGVMSSCLTPILPVFIVCGIFKMVSTLFGPKNLGLLPAESNLYILCELVNAAGYYFLPFMVAYTASKRFKCSPILSMLLVAISLHPTMLDIVAAGEGFSIFGIPMKLINYSQAVIPVIMMVWALSYVEKFAKKICPDLLRTLGVPTLTMIIMLPLGYCLFGPICNVVMGWLADLIVFLTDKVGILAIILVGAVWALVISFGMHVPIMMALLPVWVEMGYDAIVSPAGIASAFAGFGVEIAYALRAARREDRALGWECFVTNFAANIGEPYIYGIYLRDKNALLWHVAGSVAGSLVMFILGAKIVMFSGVGFPILNFVRFGEYAVQGAIGMAVATAVSLVLGLVFGFNKHPETTEE